MTDAPAPREPPNVDAILEAVRAAAEGIADVRAARAARQTRAACQDVIATLAELGAGSPEAMRLRAGLKELGIASKALDAGLTWWRAHAKGRGPNAGEDLRPAIQLDPDQLDTNVDTAIEYLQADPELYAREGALVRITHDDEGAPVITPHTPATMRLRLARFMRFIDAKGTPTTPPDVITAGVLEVRRYPGIRVIAGIVETPTLRPDRTVCQTPGYDVATKLLYLPTCEFPSVPESPTEQEAADALRFLWVETSYDFPFRGMEYADPALLTSDPEGVFRFIEAKNHAHAWGLVSAMLTIVGRPGIAGDVPAHVFDASGPGSGKGLSLDVVCLGTIGRQPTKLTWPSSSDAGEVDTEVAKMLGGEIMGGGPIIAWDEITGAFGCAAINNVLTCNGRTKVRPLGQSPTIALAYKAVMLGAGNNITMRDNTHRRTLVPRIESPDENPEDHDGWRRSDLRASVLELRPRLVAAALTVLRGYVVAGMPSAGLPHWGGGFEAWNNLVARAIAWAGGGDVLGCRPTADPDARNEERETMGVVLDAIAKLEPHDANGVATGAGITTSSILDALYTRDRLKGEAPVDGFEDAREAIDTLTGTSPGRKPESRKLAKALRLWKSRKVGGRTLVPAAKKDRCNVQRWTVMRR